VTPALNCASCGSRFFSAPKDTLAREGDIDEIRTLRKPRGCDRNHLTVCGDKPSRTSWFEGRRAPVLHSQALPSLA